MGLRMSGSLGVHVSVICGALLSVLVKLFHVYCGKMMKNSKHVLAWNLRGEKGWTSTTSSTDIDVPFVITF